MKYMFVLNMWQHMEEIPAQKCSVQGVFNLNSVVLDENIFWNMTQGNGAEAETRYAETGMLKMWDRVLETAVHSSFKYL